MADMILLMRNLLRLGWNRGAILCDRPAELRAGGAVDIGLYDPGSFVDPGRLRSNLINGIKHLPVRRRAG